MSLVKYRKHKEFITFWVECDKAKYYVCDVPRYDLGEDFIRGLILGANVFGNSIEEVVEVE